MARIPAKVFSDLIVWQRAHQFVLASYRATRLFPKEELYGLTSQLRRAAVSIPANIAEGFRRLSKSEKCRFINIAQSSLEECRYYLILARDLEYPMTPDLPENLDEVSRLLNAYATAIARDR